MNPARMGENYRRLLAAFCAATVFALGLFAQSPALHRQLHPDGHLPSNDQCAVVLFASGVSTSVALTAPPPPDPNWQEFAYLQADDALVGSPRYRLRPERGPPAA